MKITNTKFYYSQIILYLECLEASSFSASLKVLSLKFATR